MIIYLILCFTVLTKLSIAEFGLTIRHTHEDDTSDMAKDVQLEDFFWTGSGDGPPEYIKKVHNTESNGKKIIVKTETIVATVYGEGENGLDETCMDCTNDGIPLIYNNTDRRYWLLTVIAGFLRLPDYSMLENELANLYRLAFTRQQSRHLGINNFNNSYSEMRMKRQVKENQKELNIGTEEIKEKKSEYRKTKYVLELPTINSTQNKNSYFTFSKNHNIKRNLFSNEHEIKVSIHNFTLITEDDIQNWDNSFEEIMDRRHLRPFANQTEIIYSVFVNGKPILATTAAEDMKLISENEMTEIIKKNIYVKVEPYLKEPLATPLVPDTKNATLNIFSVINHNPIIIAISSILIFLLLVLLIALLLITRMKRWQNAKIRRLSNRQVLISELQVNSNTKAAALKTELKEEISNLGFYHNEITENNRNDHQNSPSITFPMPSIARPSSTSTSDSSLYYPVNRPNVSLQNMLDEKAANLFEKKRRHPKNKNEVVYTTVDKKRDRKSKNRLKRKYLNENRVGSIEEAQIHFPQYSGSSDSFSDSYKPNSDQIVRNKVFYLNNKCHKNKILQNHVFSNKANDCVNEPIFIPTEAINREIIKTLQHGDKSSENGSIGSFLSMTSVKSFPRNVLPEPLQRVLEPVTVTYYDHDDENNYVIGPKRKTPKLVTVTDQLSNEDQITVAYAHSDDPDPGVIGPIVWEIHKNRLENEKYESPVRNPAMSRTRYEVLLEGAIELYGNKSKYPLCKESPSPNCIPGIIRPRELRGKSAIASSRLTRSHSENRPFTASLNKSSSTHSTQPPSPNGKAWGSCSTSPLVRPLSADPFHRSQISSIEVKEVLVSELTGKKELSAAPLIEAIQNELKKFKRQNSQ